MEGQKKRGCHECDFFCRTQKPYKYHSIIAKFVLLLEKHRGSLSVRHLHVIQCRLAHTCPPMKRLQNRQAQDHKNNKRRAAPFSAEAHLPAWSSSRSNEALNLGSADCRSALTHAHWSGRREMVCASVMHGRERANP